MTQTLQSCYLQPRYSSFINDTDKNLNKLKTEDGIKLQLLESLEIQIVEFSKLVMGLRKMGYIYQKSMEQILYSKSKGEKA